MISFFINLFLKKEIVLYNHHRQTIPILSDPENKRKYFFIRISKIIKLIPVRSKYKLKYKLIYCLISFIKPKYILDINWIGKDHLLYKLWCDKHPPSKFIVLQHGAYVGGIVTDIPHRYTHCNIFLTWGSYFTDNFKKLNSNKQLEIKNFGNSVYNQYQRESFTYPEAISIKRILLAPSGIQGIKLEALIDLYEVLISKGFEVQLKEHQFQESKFAKIEGLSKIKGNLYDWLEGKHFDLVICDHGSSMLDAIFFKNPVLFFSAPDEETAYHDNIYSTYLKNFFSTYKSVNTKTDLNSLIDLSAQEMLFKHMISSGSNKI